MELPFTLLKISGLNVKNKSKLVAIVQFVIVSSLCVLGILYPILTPNAGIDIWAGAYDPTLFLYEWSSKMLTFQLYKRSINKLVHHMHEDFWSLNIINAEIGIKLNRFQSHVMRFFKIYAIVLASTFIITAITSLIHTESRELPIAMYQVVDFTKFPYYQIVYFIYFAQIYVIITFIIAFDGMFLVFLLSVGCQFILINDSLKIIPNSDKYDDEKFIRRIVKHHGLLLEFIDELKKVFSVFLLSQLGSNCIANCMSIYLFNAIGISKYTDVLQYILYAIASSTQIFIYCVSGNQIKIVMEDIASTMYSTDWYDKDKPKLRNAALLVIQRAQKDSSLKAGGMFKVDLELFVAVMRLSFSYFTLMKSMKEENVL